MDRLRRLLTLLICLGGLVALDGPQVEMIAAPTQVAVGDRVLVTITYRWPRSWKAAEPDPTAVFADTFVVDCPPPEIVRTAEEERRVWRLGVLSQRSGPWTLPAPRLSAMGPAGAQEATAPAVVVNVGAETQPPQPAARRPLWTAGAGETESRRWLIAVIALVVAIAAGIGWWLLGRRRSVPQEPPGDRLRRELLELAGLRDGKEVGARLGLALRRWCGAVFAYDGPGLTTRETLLRLRRELDDGEYAALGRLLGDLDDLRWAAGALDASVVLPLSERALAWSDGVQRRLDRLAVERAAQAAKPTVAPPQTQGSGA